MELMDEEKKQPVVDLNEEKMLIEWEAAERSFKKRNRDFWITAVAILILVSVIFIFIKEFFLVIALGSLLFLGYVLSTVPPGMAKYKITNRGIYFGEQFYPWEILERFWFKNSLDSEMIHFGTLMQFPRVISMVIMAEDKEKIKEIVVKRIPMIQESPTFVDKTTAWFSKRLPLEDKPAGKDK
jgi:hypothetical protein